MKTTPIIIVATAVVTAGGIAAASALTPMGNKAANAFEDTIIKPVASSWGGWGQGGRHGRGGANRQAMVELMRQADTNGDRALDQEEINTFVASKFTMGDQDADAAITLEEFETIWADLTRQPMVRVFQRLDQDGDAAITITEINERFGSIVEERDRNGDGVLNRADRPRQGKRSDRHRDDDDRDS
ncbi:MAG: hypothetical protein AAGJ94_12380 [Pseudomonadota bacterium]